jgi:hypothetical protein
MGRVARYKRIKAVDPFNKRTGGKIDVDAGKVLNDAPKGAHQPVPRALRHLLQLKRGLAQGPRAKVAPQRSFSHIVAQPGESLASFRRRLNAAHTKLRAEAPARAPKGISEKRKRFHQRQKERKRGGGGDGDGDGHDGSDAEDRQGAGGGGEGGAQQHQQHQHQLGVPGRGIASARLADLTTFEGSRRGALRLSSTQEEQGGGGGAHALPFATQLSDYHVGLLPADLKRAKRKREEAGGLVGLDAWEKPQAPAFGERVEAPPKLAFLPRKAHRSSAGGGGGGDGKAAPAAPTAFGMPHAKKARREAEAAKAAALRDAQLEVERERARQAFKAMKERRREALLAGGSAALQQGGPRGALQALTGAAAGQS